MKPRVFVLVHPAWHGAWCWKRVVPLLRQQGHEVSTPTLTGLGERSHLARREIGLEVHVNDVVNVLGTEDLRDVVLVGHSSSGAVIAGVADRAPEQSRTSSIWTPSFLNTVSPCWISLARETKMMEALVATEGDGWLLPRFAPPPWETIVREMWGVSEIADVRVDVGAALADTLWTFQGSRAAHQSSSREVTASYVRCPQFPNARFDQHAAMARRSERWRYRELASSHHPAITVPGQVADVLLELAA